MSKIMMVAVNDQDSLPAALKLISSIIIDKPVMISVDTITKQRTRSQNDMQWAGMLEDFANQAQLGGRFFSAATWHEYLKEKHLPEHWIEGETLTDYVKWIEMPGGHLKMVGSTKKLTILGFSNYLEKCYAFGGGLGVRFTSTKEY
jgi:hypothetical protein